MARVPRERFLPADQVAWAAQDRPLPIGRGQTNSQPSTVATMLWLLDVQPGQRVLDVGAGSGWTTALLADLVGPAGEVIGVELEPDLVAPARRNLAATDQPWARIEPADPDRLGYAAAAPYDRILVSAMAVEIPSELSTQLDRVGVMVLPAGGRLVRVVRDVTGATVDRFGHYRFVPLR